MQKPKLVYSRTEEFCETIEPQYYYEVWKKNTILPKSRTKLYSSRYKREVQFDSITRNSVAESLENIGAGDSIYNVSKEERGEDFDGFSEDSDIDHTQSKRWRGG
eukprot:GHVO01059503.1.p4 GENE.GHVO01059503.1~~GHVO01059503.1.p4  ORF type:complete len:105 (-),score=9.86 GHVO01059503.1:1295-1609(-)